MPGTVKLWETPRHSRGVSPVYASVSDVCSAEIETDVVATSAIPSVLESFDHGDLLSTDTEEVLAVPNVPDEAGPPRRATP